MTQKGAKFCVLFYIKFFKIIFQKSLKIFHENYDIYIEKKISLLFMCKIELAHFGGGMWNAGISRRMLFFCFRRKGGMRYGGDKKSGEDFKDNARLL